MKPALAAALDLEPHPEGGWYRQTWVSPATVSLADGRTRSAATLIYFLLPAGEASAWHRFAELSERVQEMQLAQTPPTPLGSALKILGDLAKTYLPGGTAHGEWVNAVALPRNFILFAEPFYILAAGVFSQATPPPELIG